ncbi:hypothetical protein QFC21_000505 [Naganishia friedmannii]|uniref:Uncharacterized protein n=1 Tax=Naganishia friedmannii TaxID=89922 RepID=A0ACC2WCQ4_9TREE|nr:hypothetical protein QFC21_000505 [Naganishia friedmannii]
MLAMRQDALNIDRHIFDGILIRALRKISSQKQLDIRKVQIHPLCTSEEAKTFQEGGVLRYSTNWYLGNYLGAIQNWVKLQESLKLHSEDASADPEAPSKILYSIVGLHAITMPQDPKVLKRERREALACLLACGLGPGADLQSQGKRATLFFQEEVPEHAELAWYFNTLTGVGKLQRMTTWKSKLAIAAAEGGDSATESVKSEENLRLGLLAYPVLQAADILLYKSTHVPVGEDQQQHLELSRDIADSFNHRFGKTFPLPQHMIAPTKRVLSLTDPSQKMSKSAPNPASRILITDTPEQIHKKIRGAVTDNDRSVTFDPIERKGLANLLSILSACQSDLPPGGDTQRSLNADEVPHPDLLAAQLTAQGISGHAQLKSIVADAVITKLQPIREGYARLKEDVAYLRQVASIGREEARNTACRTMEEVRKRVGLDSI